MVLSRRFEGKAQRDKIPAMCLGLMINLMSKLSKQATEKATKSSVKIGKLLVNISGFGLASVIDVVGSVCVLVLR